MADTYLCNIRWADGNVARGYLKRFTRNKKLALVNEVTGYLLGKACGLPVPNKAGFIKTPTDVFPQGEPLNPFEEWAFVVISVPGDSPGSFYNENLISECKALMNLIANWSKVSDTIAFDDWTANEDRNLGNAIIAGKDEVYLIDHSNLPIRLCWAANDLDPSYQAKSALVQNLNWAESTPLPIKAKISTAAKTHKDSFKSILEELSAWWDVFLGADPNRRKALESFLSTRANQGPSRISQNYNMLAV